MIEGRVSPDGKAFVAVAFGVPTGERVVAVQVDTGFDEWLALTGGTIRTLGLVQTGESGVTFADGSSSVQNVYAANIRWHGEWLEVPAIELDDAEFNLLGMSLMGGCDLHMEIVPEGRVTLVPRQQHDVAFDPPK